MKRDHDGDRDQGERSDWPGRSPRSGFVWEEAGPPLETPTTGIQNQVAKVLIEHSRSEPCDAPQTDGRCMIECTHTVRPRAWTRRSTSPMRATWCSKSRACRCRTPLSEWMLDPCKCTHEAVA